MKKPVSFQIIIVLLAVIYTMSSAHAGGWEEILSCRNIRQKFQIHGRDRDYVSHVT